MKILRKEALALLNACFADDTNGRFMDSANQYNLHFDFVRMQLTSAIFSLYTNRIWQKFCANPIDVMDKYQGWDLLVEITTNAITEFFDNYPKLYLPLKLYMREDIGTVNNLIIDSTEIGSCKTYKKLERIIESFHKYWAMCWETTNIPKNIPENDIKIDAFIYFTALYNLYEDRLEDLYNDLRIAISEQVWTDKRMNQIIYKDNAVRHQDFNSDVDSYKFQCSLFRKIVISKVFDGYDLSDTNQVFFYKTYTSLLFPPIMSLIKDLAIISLAEYTFYLKIIHSDKNFWGTEWADDHINKNRLIPNEAMEMLTKQIEKATSSIFSNLINNTGKKKSLPPIPIFEEAVERGYFAMQDSEGHYRTLKQLSHCFDNNPELISLSIQTLRLYIRKPDGTEYGDKTISNLVYG